jgi:hypothetical protein
MKDIHFGAVNLEATQVSPEIFQMLIYLKLETF